MIYSKVIMADTLTPVSVYQRISADSERAFLLESVEKGERQGRYSFIGVDPEGSYTGSLQDLREEFRKDQKAPADLPPFTGGAVGFFNYEMVNEFEEIRGLSRDFASAQMDFYPTILAFDHLRHRIIVMSHISSAKVREVTDKLLSPANGPGALNFLLTSDELESVLSHSREAGLRELQRCSDFTPEEFGEAVRKAKEYIFAGDIFQVVLSQSFTREYRGNPFNVYRILRYLNPSPYMFYLKQGPLCLAGASPEMLVQVQGKDLEYRPIAGTRRRGLDMAEDEHLGEELLADEKEKAEHLMLVDLGRNDLGRISEYGGVKVEEFMRLERYSHVMHLVSSLRGRLRSDRDRFDALSSCFPAGTVTGAPKIRAMEIIQELEKSPRGFYAGAAGYLDYSGNLDTCIAIRTIMMRDGQAHFRAGAGIVADSVPAKENLECLNKASVLDQALTMAGRFDFMDQFRESRGY